MEKMAKREMKCVLTKDELLERGEAVGRESTALADAQERKKDVTKQLSADVERHRVELARLGQELANGYVYRTIDCVEAFDYAAGKVTITRLDTGEVVEVRPIKEEERQSELSL